MSCQAPEMMSLKPTVAAPATTPIKLFRSPVTQAVVPESAYGKVVDDPRATPILLGGNPQQIRTVAFAYT
jgi:hypothetical protein